MPKKKKTKPKEKSQRRRFIEFAKEHGADEDAEALEQAFEKVVRSEGNKKAPDADSTSKKRRAGAKS